jgi:hypothetical protein
MEKRRENIYIYENENPETESLIEIREMEKGLEK